MMTNYSKCSDTYSIPGQAKHHEKHSKLVLHLVAFRLGCLVLRPAALIQRLSTTSPLSDRRVLRRASLRWDDPTMGKIGNTDNKFQLHMQYYD